MLSYIPIPERERERERERECVLKEVDLRPLACLKYRFESRRRQGRVSGECCVFSDRDLFVGLITLPEESCRVWCVWVWSCGVGNEGGPGSLGGFWAVGGKN